MRRWGRYDAPIMVCVELDEAGQNGKVVNVVLGDEHDDVALARDHRGHFLVYDDAMQRIRTDEGTEGGAINIAEYREWPDRHDWEEGPGRPALPEPLRRHRARPRHRVRPRPGHTRPRRARAHPVSTTHQDTESACVGSRRIAGTP
jgi:hypothetical protein